MITVTLEQKDVMQVEVILLDQDGEAALRFLRECLLPQIQRLQGSQMKSHLDGGKGSAF